MGVCSAKKHGPPYYHPCCILEREYQRDSEGECYVRIDQVGDNRTLTVIHDGSVIIEVQLANWSVNSEV